MTTSDVLATPDRPYAPAWPHRLTRAIDRLPVPNWLFYPALAALGTAALALRFWATGQAPVGSIDQNSLTFGILIPAMILAYRYVERSSVSGFDAFRPALRQTADAEGIRYRMSVLPAVAGWTILGVGVVLTSVTFAFTPADSLVAGVPGWVAAVAWVLEVLNDALLFSVIVQMIRQMRIVRRVLAEETKVDIFRPGPLHALAGVSARAGTVIVLLTGTVTILVVPTTGAGDILLAVLPYIVAPTAIAVAAFLVPLYGTHGKLVAEKRRLEGLLDDRLERLLGEVGAEVDARRLTAIDQQSKAVAYVLQERDIVAKLSTWPWSTTTMRGFVSAILFPVGIFLIQRAILAVTAAR